MDNFDILRYLERRQLGYEFKNKLSHVLMDNIGYMPQKNDNVDNPNIGNTFACKFSRNKNNLHMVGCSTEHGEVIIQNTFDCYNDQNKQYTRNGVHENAIFNLAWAEPQMKLITACGDQSTKLFTLNPSGTLDEEGEFMYNSSVKSVMFCPGSSDVFCGGSQDGSVKVWDARVNNGQRVMEFEHNIPNAHGIYESKSKNKKFRKMYGISTVIFKNDQTIISCSSLDSTIKLWDLRKSYRQVNGNTEPLPLVKYSHPSQISQRLSGYTDIVIHPQSNLLYASCLNNVIYCFQLDSTETKPICEYSGHLHETPYSKISISHDGRYLFTGCMSFMGLIWLTESPFKKDPMFNIKYNFLNSKKELSISDWCADPASIKLVTSSDSMPEVWSILTHEQKKSAKYSFCRSPYYSSKFFSKVSTVPIKFETELKEKYKKETEETMKNWDIQNHNFVPIAEHLNVTPKKPWNVFFNKKTTSSSSISSQNEIKSTHSTLEDSNKIPEAVTPTSSKKRKNNVVSPRSLIDQYLVPKRKREKLDTVSEI